MGWACDLFFWTVFWMNWVKHFHLGGMAMAPADFLFPTVGASGALQLGMPLSSDAVQKMLNAAMAGAGLRGKYMLHCFRRGGVQYRFMFAPLGKRWPLRCIRWWGNWTEGEKVSSP